MELSDYDPMVGFNPVLAISSGDQGVGAGIVAQKPQIYAPYHQLWNFDRNGRIHSLSCSNQDRVIAPTKVDITEDGIIIGDAAKPISPVGLFLFNERCKYQMFSREGGKIYNTHLKKYLSMPQMENGRSCFLQLACKSETKFQLKPYGSMVFFIYNPMTGYILRGQPGSSGVFVIKLKENIDKLRNCLDALWYEEPSAPNVYRSAATGYVLNVVPTTSTNKRTSSDLRGSSDTSATVVLQPFSEKDPYSTSLIWSESQFGDMCHGIISPNDDCDPVKAVSGPAVETEKKIWVKVPLNHTAISSQKFEDLLDDLKEKGDEIVSNEICNSLPPIPPNEPCDTITAEALLDALKGGKGPEDTTRGSGTKRSSNEPVSVYQSGKEIRALDKNHYVIPESQFLASRCE